MSNANKENSENSVLSRKEQLEQWRESKGKNPLKENVKPVKQPNPSVAAPKKTFSKSMPLSSTIMFAPRASYHANCKSPSAEKTVQHFHKPIGPVIRPKERAPSTSAVHPLVTPARSSMKSSHSVAKTAEERAKQLQEWKMRRAADTPAKQIKKPVSIPAPKRIPVKAAEVAPARLVFSTPARAKSAAFTGIRFGAGIETGFLICFAGVSAARLIFHSCNCFALSSAVLATL
eukprot:TRINITY_DN11011_c0_g3_i1.p2 TRINITY_DN11011_c0_g3~~TRINITY_DN11011_c0_g3_i1.p2  ORF type:complete len:232 (-),score=47.19 TRINITY_DN11011_c0_g3_i1:477-1172(-)